VESEIPAATGCSAHSAALVLQQLQQAEQLRPPKSLIDRCQGQNRSGVSCQNALEQSPDRTSLSIKRSSALGRLVHRYLIKSSAIYVPIHVRKNVSLEYSRILRLKGENLLEKAGFQRLRRLLKSFHTAALSL